MTQLDDVCQGFRVLGNVHDSVLVCPLIECGVRRIALDAIGLGVDSDIQ